MDPKVSDPKLDDISLDARAGERPVVEGDNPRRLGRMGAIVIAIILVLSLGVALMPTGGFASLLAR